MSKVEISNTGGRWRMTVDGGPNLASAIRAGGLRVEFPEQAETGALVHVTLMARELTLDLDNAVVEASQALLADHEVTP
jgi:hypothetical protein